MFELEMIEAPGADAADVPVPVLGRAVLFVGLDGRMCARLPDGSFVVSAAGAQGVPGVPGAAGAAGAQGLKGDTGATGAQGVPGAAGAAGAQGLKGDTGATGAQGVPGAAGAAGAQGLKGDTGATGAQGVPGVDGLPGQLVSLHTATLGQTRPGLAAGLLVHDFTFNANLIGKLVRARFLLSVNSSVSVTVSALLSIGGMVCEFSGFASNGARLVRVDIDMHVQAAGVAQGGAYQGSGTLTGTAAMVFAQRVSTAGNVAGQSVALSIKGALSAVTVLSASIEVL